MSVSSKKTLKLISLFDGSGGFPLAASMVGIDPVYASEVEPFPIRVTTKRFPSMRHLGDVCKIDGSKLDFCDIVTFGSPCQDLSLVGKHAGLNGSKSSLFFEAVRVVREMRCASYGRYPRYVVWENVCGAFSSNSGEDFRSVLQAIVSLSCGELSIPRCERWSRSGLILGDSFSVGWRVLDSEFWGVPQRRQRIFLVADLNGKGAGKILFESEGLSRNSYASGKTWSEFASGVDGRFASSESGVSDVSFPFHLNVRDELINLDGISGALLASKNVRCQTFLASPQFSLDDISSDFSCVSSSGDVVSIPSFVSLDFHGQDSRISLSSDDVSQTLCSRMGTGGDNVPLILSSDSLSYSLGCESLISADFAPAVDCELSPCIVARAPAVVSCAYRVRQLTPLECCRLQGFPDSWCDDLGCDDVSSDDFSFWRGVFDEYSSLNGSKVKSDSFIRRWLKRPYSDAAAYKMWGNGVALPCVYFVMAGIEWFDRCEEFLDDSYVSVSQLSFL